VKLLEHPNIWHRRMAQRLLIERGDSAIASLLRETAATGKTLESRLAALWTLHDSQQLEESMLEKLAVDKEPAMRTWAARLTGERLQVSEQALGRLHSLAADRDASVRLAVATAARQFVSGSLTVNTPGPQPGAEPKTSEILVELVNSSADGKDPFIPFMIWMAGEPTFAKNPERPLNWLAENGAATMPLSGILARKAMRRICDTQEKSKLDLAAHFLDRVAGANSRLAVDAIEGLIEGQRAKPMAPSLDTKSLFEMLNGSSHGQLKERARELGALWGNADSIHATLHAINDSVLALEPRKQAIDVAKKLKNPAAREALLQLINTGNAEALVVQAIEALGEIGGDGVPDDLLKQWDALSAAARRTAAEVLVSRRRWAIALLSAVETKNVKAIELPATAIRALGDSKDEFIRQRALEVIGRIRPANADKQKLIEEKKRMILSAGPPDVEKGHELVRKTCLICHKFYGEGAEVGPDLTGVGRSSLDALLANVIDPNQVIGKGYENVEVETKDGRSLSGRLVENTDIRVKLLSAGPKEEVVAKSDVASMRVSELSVMPEGLEQMPEADFRNLILYVLNPPQEKASK